MIKSIQCWFFKSLVDDSRSTSDKTGRERTQAHSIRNERRIHHHKSRKHFQIRRTYRMNGRKPTHFKIAEWWLNSRESESGTVGTVGSVNRWWLGGANEHWQHIAPGSRVTGVTLLTFHISIFFTISGLSGMDRAT